MRRTKIFEGRVLCFESGVYFPLWSCLLTLSVCLFYLGRCRLIVVSRVSWNDCCLWSWALTLNLSTHFWKKKSEKKKKVNWSASIQREQGRKRKIFGTQIFPPAWCEILFCCLWFSLPTSQFSVFVFSSTLFDHRFCCWTNLFGRQRTTPMCPQEE